MLERARALLRKRHFRVEPRRRRRSPPSAGCLREAGNLLFHLSVLIVLVGFAVGGCGASRAACWW